MNLELTRFNTVQEGVRELGDTACSMRQDLVARVKTPVLEDGTDLWKDTWLDSKDVNFYGRTNDDNRYRFKMDHAFGLKKIVDAKLRGGAVPSNKDDYLASTGSEFIILDNNHAIRADEYQKIRNKLGKDGYSLDGLKDGIFKINLDLTPDEIIKYDQSKKIETVKHNKKEL